MRQVIFVFMVIVVALSVTAFSVYFNRPQPVPTAVIGEKPHKAIGGQAVTVLPERLSDRQHRLLRLAYETGQRVGIQNPEIVQAVLLQETLAGGLSRYRVANPGPEAYFGLMQVKLAAARDVLSRWPELYREYGFHTRTDDEVKANLILNERFNIEIGARYLLLLRQTYGLSGKNLLTAYNRGPGGVNPGAPVHPYATAAEKKLATLAIKN